MTTEVKVGPDALNMELFTPKVIKNLGQKAEKYRKAHRSFRFGIVKGLSSKYVVLLIIGVIGGAILLLFVTGKLGV